MGGMKNCNSKNATFLRTSGVKSIFVCAECTLFQDEQIEGFIRTSTGNLCQKNML